MDELTIVLKLKTGESEKNATLGKVEIGSTLVSLQTLCSDGCVCETERQRETKREREQVITPQRSTKNCCFTDNGPYSL